MKPHRGIPHPTLRGERTCVEKGRWYIWKTLNPIMMRVKICLVGIDHTIWGPINPIGNHLLRIRPGSVFYGNVTYILSIECQSRLISICIMINIRRPLASVSALSEILSNQAWEWYSIQIVFGIEIFIYICTLVWFLISVVSSLQHLHW